MSKLKFLLLFCALLPGIAPLTQGAEEAAPVGVKAERPPFKIPRDEINRMRAETVMAVDFVEEAHYHNLKLDQINPDELIERYLEELDYNKVFFLQEDLNQIQQRFRENIIKANLSKGNLYPAFEIYKIYRKRVLERLDWVYARLNEDFDFETDKTFRPDRKDLEFPKDISEADELWNRRITYEMLLEIVNNETMDKARERLTRRYQRIERYILNIEPHNVQEMFLNAYCGLFDPHTNFFSVETAEDFEIATKNSLVGIGAVLTDEDGYCTIRELMPGGPAEMSGQLLPGDKILAISQDGGTPVDVVDMKLTKVVQMIRGKKGTPVYLHVQAAGRDERKLIVLIREEIELTANLAKATISEIPNEDGTVSKIGVIDLPSFYGESGDGKPAPTTSADVEELIEKLKAYHIDGLVLDLRRNGGGLLSETIKLVGLFIPKGPVVMVRSSDGSIRQDWDRDPKVAYDGPLMVLISRNSASASEITAGALQALGRAIIVGDSTSHGKGTVQWPWPLENGVRQYNPFVAKEKMGMVKVTIQKFYLPNGSSTQKEGVSSDIFIPNVNEYLPIGESDLDNVLEWDTLDSIQWDPAQVIPPNTPHVTPELIDYLKARSQLRRETLPEFGFLNEQIEWFKERQEKKEYSLNLEKRQAQKDADKAFSEEMEDRQDALAENGYNETDIELELSKEREVIHQEKLLHSTLPDGRSKQNTYYQKMFYYLNPETNEIKVLNLEHFDYEKVLEHTDELASILRDKYALNFSDEMMTEALTRLKNSDIGSDFQVEETFREQLPELTDEAIQEFMPDLCIKMIEIYPDVLLERPKLDIHMREAMRIMADWVEYSNGKQFLDSDSIQQAVARSDQSVCQILKDAAEDR